jgi:hypothetical protein
MHTKAAGQVGDGISACSDGAFREGGPHLSPNAEA